MENTETPKKKFNPAPYILGVVAIAVIIFVIKKVTYSMHNEDTDNSQIECNISPIVPKVAGFIEEIRVRDNQFVHKGDTLVRIDDRDLQLKVKQAEVALANAEANVELSKASQSSTTANVNVASKDINPAQSAIDAAQVRLTQAQQDYERFKKLFDLGSGTQQQLDNATAARDLAQKQLEQAQKSVASYQARFAASSSNLDVSKNNLKVAQIQVEQRKEELDLAKLNLSYATITAPADGYVSKKSVQPGQLVSVGQNLFALVDEGEIWVMANFKETQIEKMKVGQKVKIEVDAYPGKDFEGTIESLSAATGSKFALLPPDNATGNFVKVVQRIPVKIIIDKNQNKEYPLRAGMNVKAVVKVS
ncbi:MAG: secretion protein HlyD family protein [Bacteroidetes bacterium]|nr:secretion protein HlyD family protein [Bacteroidota bacterium]